MRRADFSGEPIDARDGFGSEFWWHIAWTPLQIKAHGDALDGQPDGPGGWIV